MFADFHHYLPGILLAYGAFALGMFSPGPNILSIMGTSMSVGRDAGKALALGISTGSLVWGALTSLGLTALIAAYAAVMVAIKTAGALYLLWLALKAFRSAASKHDMALKTIAVSGGGWAWYRRGLMIQLTNPKAALTWLAIMSLALDATAPWWVAAVIVAGTAAFSAAGHIVYAITFSTQPMVAAYRKARRIIEAGLGTFFCYASYKIATAKS